MDVKPALTAEGWELGRLPIAELHADGRLLIGDYGAPSYVSTEERHALAALALYGQPFGVTREDVALLRASGDFIAQIGDMYDAKGEAVDVSARMASLADRIEALLPPEK